MAQTTAEDLKVQGNVAYNAGDFAKAVELYTSAIESDPKNYVYYNNRSAAYYHQRDYIRAMEDARVSLRITSNSRGFLRLGLCFEAQGKLGDAKDNYDMALSLSPADIVIRQRLKDVREKMSQGTSSTASQPRTSAKSNVIPAVDSAVVVTSVAHLIMLLLVPELGFLLWKVALSLMLIRQIMNIRQTGRMPRALADFKNIFGTLDGQYAMLCIIFLVMGAPPIHLALAAMCMYCALDLTCFPAFVRRIPLSFVHPYLDKVAAYPNELRLNAALCEILAGVTSIFVGGGLSVPLVMWQFLRQRYRTDQWSRMAFTQTANLVENGLQKNWVPAFVRSGFAALRSTLGRMAA